MNFKLLRGSSLLLGLFIAAGWSVAPALTQTPPSNATRTNPTVRLAATFWEPVARVDPSRPVKIQIVNKTNETIEYIVGTQTGFRRLAPGQSSQLSGIALPVYLDINPIRDRALLRYQVSVPNSKTNQALVEVYGSSSGGQRSLNIDQTGAIYIY
jgi:hypothetical protein